MIKKYIIIVLTLLVSVNTYSQNDYATINIYRPKMMLGAAVKDHIFINGIEVCFLKNGGHLEYNIFSNNKITIQIIGSMSSGNYGTPDNVDLAKGATFTKIHLDTKKGKIYNFKLKPKFQRISIEQIDYPINKRKLKTKNYISLSDIDFKSNVLIYNHPKTDWTKDKLIKYWNENGAKNIEGIYEKVGTILEYELAIIKENNNYKIIYLSGANGTSWQEGDLKATLKKSAQFGIFKSDWYMLNKSKNDDIIITFEKATMKLIAESGNGDDLYLKMFPTYDETSDNKENSEWKSFGTGFFIDKKGYIVTNHHVIDEGSIFEISITKNGIIKSYFADIISTDKQNDLAILKIKNFNELTNLLYNFSTKTKDVGTSVFALGYPLTHIMGKEIKFTDGKISSKSGFKGDITNYQISVPIQSGNSGGPLFDNKGNLIGITSSGINKRLDIAENANYAIKTSYLNLLIEATNDKIELPKSNEIGTLTLTEQIKILSEYVVLIKVK